MKRIRFDIVIISMVSACVKLQLYCFFVQHQYANTPGRSTGSFTRDNSREFRRTPFHRAKDRSLRLWTLSGDTVKLTSVCPPTYLPTYFRPRTSSRGERDQREKQDAESGTEYSETEEWPRIQFACNSTQGSSGGDVYCATLVSLQWNITVNKIITCYLFLLIPPFERLKKLIPFDRSILIQYWMYKQIAKLKRLSINVYIYWLLRDQRLCAGNCKNLFPHQVKHEAFSALRFQYSNLSRASGFPSRVENDLSLNRLARRKSESRACGTGHTLRVALLPGAVVHTYVVHTYTWLASRVDTSGLAHSRSRARARSLLSSSSCIPPARSSTPTTTLGDVCIYVYAPLGFSTRLCTHVTCPGSDLATVNTESKACPFFLSWRPKRINHLLSDV